jgi:hypothetical protein
MGKWRFSVLLLLALRLNRREWWASSFCPQGNSNFKEDLVGPSAYPEVAALPGFERRFPGRAVRSLVVITS